MFSILVVAHFHLINRVNIPNVLNRKEYTDGQSSRATKQAIVTLESQRKKKSLQTPELRILNVP